MLRFPKSYSGAPGLAARKQAERTTASGHAPRRRVNKIFVLVGMAMLVLPIVPYASSSNGASMGSFSRVIDANGISVNVTAVYTKNWNWDRDNVVRVTISETQDQSNETVVITDESAVLHNNESYFLLARSQVAPSSYARTQAGSDVPVELAFTFSNRSYTQNAQQGEVYPAHISIGVGLDVVSDGTTTPVYFANGPGEMVITLSTSGTPAYAPGDSILYLVAAEAVGFGAIVFFTKAAKFQ